MVEIRQLKKVQSYDDLESLGIGRIYFDISYRGGNIGFCGETISEHFNVHASKLPKRFGAYCNYLGGGIRGCINSSTFSPDIGDRKRKILTELANACVRVYENIEKEFGLNNTEDEEGNINWDAAATEKARKAGIVSAY